MKLLFDLFPVALFFFAFKNYDIYVATKVIMGATACQVAYLYLRYRKVEKMHLASLVMVWTLGFATIFLRDERFIKWKPTAVNWILAVVFGWGQMFGKTPLVKKMMEKNLQLPDNLWKEMNLSWVVFFIIVGLINILVAFNFPTSVWVNFKLFGILGLTLIFVFFQAWRFGRKS